MQITRVNVFTFQQTTDYDHLKRFLIDVVDIKTGMYDVQTYQDLHTVRDAIIYALKGAMLVA
jgi:hypothetical protein